VSVVTLYAKKACGGSRGIAPLLLNLETIKVSGQPHALAALPSMEAVELVWTLWKRENLLTPSGTESGNQIE
jgi:hypothetical protein